MNERLVPHPHRTPTVVESADNLAQARAEDELVRSIAQAAAEVQRLVDKAAILTTHRLAHADYLHERALSAMKDHIDSDADQAYWRRQKAEAAAEPVNECSETPSAPDAEAGAGFDPRAQGSCSGPA